MVVNIGRLQAMFFLAILHLISRCSNSDFSYKLNFQFYPFTYSFRHRGMTLSEVADILIYLGAQYAINMDGGSSSVMVQNTSSIVNQPACFYNAIVPQKWMSCERSVATVFCLHS
jgi:Phosphodiester glycosidase